MKQKHVFKLATLEKLVTVEHNMNYIAKKKTTIKKKNKSIHPKKYILEMFFGCHNININETKIIDCKWEYTKKLQYSQKNIHMYRNKCMYV